MRRYVVQRLVQSVFLLWVVITFMFVLFRLLPGDPVSIVVSAELPEQARAALRQSWGLDRPLGEQYIAYLANLVQGNFGLSFQHQKPVWSILSEKLVNTLVLMIPATVLAVVLGVAGGMYFGWKRGSRVERLGILLPPIIRGIPPFWLGILLLMLFSYGLGWFPIGGMRAIGVEARSARELYLSTDFLWHLTLPLLCMAITSLPEPLLIMRSSLLETRGEDYLELIEAKGASEARVLFHAARGSLLPVMTWVVHMFGYAMASTVVIEMVFAWPGLGREIITAVGSFDYPMAQAAFFLISLIIITLNLLLDLCYGLLDPRVVIA